MEAWSKKEWRKRRMVDIRRGRRKLLAVKPPKTNFKISNNGKLY